MSYCGRAYETKLTVLVKQELRYLLVSRLLVSCLQACSLKLIGQMDVHWSCLWLGSPHVQYSPLLTGAVPGVSGNRLLKPTLVPTPCVSFHVVTCVLYNVCPSKVFGWSDSLPTLLHRISICLLVNVWFGGCDLFGVINPYGLLGGTGSPWPLYVDLNGVCGPSEGILKFSNCVCSAYEHAVSPFFCSFSFSFSFSSLSSFSAISQSRFSFFTPSLICT